MPPTPKATVRTDDIVFAYNTEGPRQADELLARALAEARAQERLQGTPVDPTRLEAARWAVGQLRHLYELMLKGYVGDTAEAARGLLGPAIARLEPLTTAYARGAPEGQASQKDSFKEETNG